MPTGARGHFGTEEIARDLCFRDSMVFVESTIFLIEISLKNRRLAGQRRKKLKRSYSNYERVE
jgi:hypothetical protein